jgi:hypothetical protein
MKLNFDKIASILAVMIGSMAIFAGGKVLLGNDPGYYVVNWVPVYNYTAGLLTVFVTAILVWRSSKHALLLAIGTFSAHGIVMVVLQTAFRDVVAAESVAAMTMRLIVWSIILILLVVQRSKKTARQNMLAKETRETA